MIDFIVLYGQNEIIRDRNKFKFCVKVVQFGGFCITATELKPLDKFIRAIKEFPMPQNLADVWSWIGLINPVGHYNKLCRLEVTFKPLLSPRNQFVWNEEVDPAFRKCKDIILNTIKEGVEIFDVFGVTCPRLILVSFCPRNIVHAHRNLVKWCNLVGSRIFRSKKTCYTPIEGEELAIAWSLEQTQYFTLGYDNLLIMIGHKPLTKLFSDRTLDEITNPGLLRIKQCILL